MDLDSILSVVLLAVSMAGYFAVSIIEGGFVAWRNNQMLVGSAKSPGRIPDDAERQRISSSVESLRLLRAAMFAASLVTAVAVAVSVAGLSWPWIGLASAIALGVLTGLGSAARAFTHLSSGLVERHGAVVVRSIALFFAPWLVVERLIARAIMVRLVRSGLSQEPGSDLRYDGAAPLGFEGEPLDEREVRMIRAVVRQDKTVSREIMVPRVDMSAVEISTPISQVAETMIESGHSKLPVYRDSPDDIAGFVYSMDLIRVLATGDREEATLQEILRPPLLIPESKTLEGLLREFQDQRVQMAIVVDEYGGVSGLVTVEDLLEEIVGEIEDEFDIDEPEVVDLSRGGDGDPQIDLLIDARIGVDQVAELTGLEIRGEGFDTLGGFVLDRLGRIPGRGDTVDHDGASIQVVSTSGRRLRRLRVTRRVTSG